MTTRAEPNPQEPFVTTTATARTAAVAALGLGLLGTVAGCAAGAATTDTGTDTGTTTSTDESYTDGTYTADGSYQSPNGTESIGVTLTIADDVVTAVEIETRPTNPTTDQYQSLFADGIADEVVGVDIDQLNVTVVSGSSLTSGGFRDAVAAIKAEALAG